MPPTDSAAASALPALAPAPVRSPLKSIVAASSGNLVEWFDFYIYSTTALYFANEFFPSTDPTSSLLKATVGNAVAFLFRPIGSWIFGRIADRQGRRKSMVLSVLLMCFGSLLVACLPTYSMIGIGAPILLTVARILQGISVGGEYGTAATYMSEVAVPGKRGFYASFQYVTLVGGQLLASVVLSVLLVFLSDEQMRSWGWRIPFLLGAVGALVALRLRGSLEETSTETTRKAAGAGTLAGIMVHWRSALIVAAYTAGGSLTYYTYTVYMQKYLANTAGLGPKTATNVMTAALFVFMCLQPVFGALSDRIGRRNSMICFSLFAVLSTVPLMTAIGAAKTAPVAFGLVVLALTGVSFYSSISGLVKAEMFPPSIRALAVGLPYAIANAMFGGSAESVALAFKKVGLETRFFWYVSAVATVALVASIVMPDSRKKGYLDPGKPGS
jgi:MHS family alpha-ketoglutarate permease-like MFS transporter